MSGGGGPSCKHISGYIFSFLSVALAPAEFVISFDFVLAVFCLNFTLFYFILFYFILFSLVLAEGFLRFDLLLLCFFWLATDLS